MVLAGDDFPIDADVDTEITRLRLSLEACAEAEQSLKAPLAKAKYEAATAVLKGIKVEHDKVVQKIVEPLAQLAHGYVELFYLGRQLKDRDCGYREDVVIFFRLLSNYSARTMPTALSRRYFRLRLGLVI